MLFLDLASEQDLPRFMQMERAADAARFVLADTLDAHQRMLAHPDVLYLRIRIADDVAGFLLLQLEPDDTSVEFRRIVVESKGLGIGRLAIREMHRLCREDLGRSRVWLDVFDYNLAARHLYEKLGYRRFGQRKTDSGTLIGYERWL